MSTGALATDVRSGLSEAGAGELLPGEQVLWEGRPGRVRLRLADFGAALSSLAVLAVIAVVGTAVFRGLPLSSKAVLVVVWGGAAIQGVGVTVYRLALRPRLRQREVYQVTDYRLVVTRGAAARQTWSAYLDQLDDPEVNQHRDGILDLRLRLHGRTVSLPVLGRWAAANGLFSTLGRRDVPALWSLADAAQVKQVVEAARQRMVDGLVMTEPEPMTGASAPPSASAALEPGERVLWAGRAGRAPWWFNAQDVYVSVSTGLWVVFIALIWVLASSHGAADVQVLVLFAVGGLCPALGRVIHRRMRIRRSAYVLTTRRLMASWRLGRREVLVQARLADLQPPVMRGQAIFTESLHERLPQSYDGWRAMLWPTATTAPPTLVGVADPQAVCALIATAQLAGRAAPSGTEPAGLAAAPDP